MWTHSDTDDGHARGRGTLALASVLAAICFFAASSGSADVSEGATEFSVTFVDGDGNTILTVTIEEGGRVTLPPAPTKDPDGSREYIFSGWVFDGGSFTADTSVTGNTTVRALFTEASTGPADADKGDNGSDVLIGAGAAGAIILILGLFLFIKARNL
jgi:hypothetical protein